MQTKTVAFQVTRDAIPFFAFYTLFFADHGLAPGQIGVLIVAWSAASFLFEIPSGALADTLDRRRLLIVGAGFYLACFVSWFAWPTFLGFLLGFLLWAVASALMSGTWEALLYDELAAIGQQDRYGRIRSRAVSLGVVGTLIATMSAAPLYAAGGYRLVGTVTLVIAALHIVAAWWLPRARPREQVAEGGRYLANLRDGVREAHRNVAVRRVIVAFAAVVTIVAFDEYFELLFRESGFATEVIPWLTSGCVAAQAIGTALADRLAHAGRVTNGAVYGVSGVLVAAGAFAGHPYGVVGIALGYGAASAAMVSAEIRLQEAIDTGARATTTSVGGLMSETAAIVSFALVAVGSGFASLAVVIGVLAVLFAVASTVAASRILSG